MDLAREQHDASSATCSAEDGRSRGSRPTRTTGTAAPPASLRDAPTAEMKEKLIAVAEHLEVVDELVDRVTELERKGNHAVGNSAEQGGTDATLAAEVQARLAAAEADFRAELEAVHNGLEKQDLKCSRLDKEVAALDEQVRDELPKLGAVMQRVASLDDDAKSQRMAHSELSDKLADVGHELRQSTAR